MKRESSEVTFVSKPTQSIFLIFLRYASAGFPSPARDFQEEELDILKEFNIDKPSVFILRMGTDAMEGEHIYIPNQAYVTVDRAVKARHGSIVVVSLNGVFLMRLLLRVKGRICLCAANSKYPELIINPEEDQLIFFGVVDMIFYKAKTSK